MPEYSYETYSSLKSNNNSTPRKVGYFKLKPGEKALVRFNYDTPKEFTISTIHEVRVGDKFRTVLCLRNGNEPIDNCPLCAQGMPLKSRIYVKLIHYVQDEQGKIIPVAEVANWPKKYADVLASRFNEYGNLRDNLFTVTRIGQGTETSYDIQFANPMKYSEDNGFVKDFSAFEDFDLSHHSYTKRTKEEIEEFLQSGEFPKKQEAPKLESSIPNQQVPPTMAQPQQEAPQQSHGNFLQAGNPRPSSQTSSDDITFSRPRRTYDIQ